MFLYLRKAGPRKTRPSQVNDVSQIENTKEPNWLEAAPGFEPGNKGFADLCLTTWLCRRTAESALPGPFARRVARPLSGAGNGTLSPVPSHKINNLISTWATCGPQYCYVTSYAISIQDDGTNQPWTTAAISLAPCQSIAA